MSLKERLLEDMKNAMKQKEVLKKNSIQMVRAAVLQVEKDNKVTLDDDGVIEVIAKEVKKRKESIPDFEKGGRQEIVDNLKIEVEILQEYLPEALSEEEVELIVKKAIDDTGVDSMKDMGKVMQVVLPQVRGRADGKLVSQIVKKLL